MQRDLLLREDVSIFPIRDLFSFLLLAYFHLVAYPVGSSADLVKSRLVCLSEKAKGNQDAS